MREEGAVCPDGDANAVGVGGGEELACRGKGERGAGRVEAHGVDEMPGGEVPHADDGVHGRGDEPAPVGREAEVADLADAAPQLADQLAGLGVDDAEGEVVAREGDEVAGAVVLCGCDGRHRVPVDLVAEHAGVEVPEFDRAVEAAADDGAVEAVDDEAGYVFGVFAFAGVECAWFCDGYFVGDAEVCLLKLLFSGLSGS